MIFADFVETNFRYLRNPYIQMKYPIVLGLFLCVTIITKAQETPHVNQHPEEKPALFAALPENLPISPAVLQQLFSRTTNQHFALSINLQFIIDAWVLEKVTISPQQESINVRCANYANALLNISRIKLPDNKTRFTGRIISPSHGDVLSLTEENGQYYFTRQKQLLTMVQ
jgi:hypothetical protein